MRDQTSLWTCTTHLYTKTLSEHATGREILQSLVIRRMRIYLHRKESKMCTYECEMHLISNDMPWIGSTLYFQSKLLALRRIENGRFLEEDFSTLGYGYPHILCNNSNYIHAPMPILTPPRNKVGAGLEPIQTHLLLERRASCMQRRGYLDTLAPPTHFNKFRTHATNHSHCVQNCTFMLLQDAGRRHEGRVPEL